MQLGGFGRHYWTDTLDRRLTVQWKWEEGGNEGGDGCLSFQTLLSVTHSARLLPFTLIFLTSVFVFISVFVFVYKYTNTTANWNTETNTNTEVSLAYTFSPLWPRCLSPSTSPWLQSLLMTLISSHAHAQKERNPTHNQNNAIMFDPQSSLFRWTNVSYWYKALSTCRGKGKDRGALGKTKCHKNSLPLAI